MELFHTLLSTVTTFFVAIAITVSSFFAPLVAEVQKELAPPLVQEEVATSTSPTTEEPESVTVAEETTEEEAVEAITPTPQQVESNSPPAPLIDSATLEALSHTALVNIYCTMKNGSRIQTVSGSGNIIDSRGVILTNAHVAQFYLLYDYPTKGAVDCVVRAGDPARDRYEAELLYLPSSWIAANASQLAADEARDTGEHDYAFLRITNVIGESGSPASFPFLSITTDEPKLGEALLLSAYPAEDLKSRAIEKRLHILSAYAGVTKLFAFEDKELIDLFSIGGTEVSQSGSSGGAAIRIHDGRLQGIIAIASVRSETIKRDLRAITVAHIDRSLAAHGLGGIVTLLARDLKEQAQDFAKNVAPGERIVLIEALED